MARKVYTDEQKAEALERFVDVGPTAAAEELGIPKQTIASWARRAGVHTVRNQQVAEAVRAKSLDWEQRRLTMAHQIGDVAQLALERCNQALEGDPAVELRVRQRRPDGTVVEVIPSPSDAKALATTMAILVDKAQLLTGATTQNSAVTVHTRDQVLEQARATALRLVPGGA